VLLVLSSSAPRRIVSAPTSVQRGLPAPSYAVGR